ncbi:hypothetical protein DWZ26_10100 [Ruminococcus sp. AF31-14BH]|jgi:hypothetical protein|nr:hypothetical protein DWZ26_10100 [Ruminococcus sp. AF31-14BH]
MFTQQLHNASNEMKVNDGKIQVDNIQYENCLESLLNLLSIIKKYVPLLQFVRNYYKIYIIRIKDNMRLSITKK